MAEVVIHDHLMSGTQQFAANHTSDISSTASNKNSHTFTSFKQQSSHKQSPVRSWPGWAVRAGVLFLVVRRLHWGKAAANDVLGWRCGTSQPGAKNSPVSPALKQSGTAL